ncbi:hypothetical protein Dthio_PD0583 [Desulfonatronospira thiodismutans ASO3-1]|uniref:Uncharacterized protein n=1 Tax=Desulfonatronospira thiodismutans ASO3-1 TaxID=555779 RepID=D6SRE1_9BACT|nr:hypothetical protein Dthio_PD0583 [Desulfonatronospira thiodismutans ASO3-1]
MEEVWGRGKNVWVYGSMGVWEWEEEEMEHGAGGRTCGCMGVKRIACAVRKIF